LRRDELLGLLGVDLLLGEVDDRDLMLSVLRPTWEACANHVCAFHCVHDSSCSAYSTVSTSDDGLLPDELKGQHRVGQRRPERALLAALYWSKLSWPSCNVFVGCTSISACTPTGRSAFCDSTT
jgi:hypothetical protein